MTAQFWSYIVTYPLQYKGEKNPVRWQMAIKHPTALDRGNIIDPILFYDSYGRDDQYILCICIIKAMLSIYRSSVTYGINDTLRAICTIQPREVCGGGLGDGRAGLKLESAAGCRRDARARRVRVCVPTRAHV